MEIKENPKYQWRIDVTPSEMSFFFVKRPKIWTRFGIWLFFGLRFEKIIEGEKNEF